MPKCGNKKAASLMVTCVLGMLREVWDIWGYVVCGVGQLYLPGWVLKREVRLWSQL